MGLPLCWKLHIWLMTLEGDGWLQQVGGLLIWRRLWLGAKVRLLGIGWECVVGEDWVLHAHCPAIEVGILCQILF